MTLYEALSLSVQVLTIIAAGGGLWFAARQLNKVTAALKESQKANTIAATAALVQVELGVFNNLSKIDSMSAAKLRLEAKRNGGEKALEYEDQANAVEMDGAIQNYLNSLDRLCACVIDRIYPEERARAEYDRILDDAITVQGRGIEDFDGHYPNIVSLRRHWKEARSEC